MKDIFVLKHKTSATRAWFTYISKGQSDFATSQGFYFQETSLMPSFMKIKPSQFFSEFAVQGELYICGHHRISFVSVSFVLYDFLVTVKAAPHE